MHIALLKADPTVSVCFQSYYLLQVTRRACCAIFSTKLFVWKILINCFNLFVCLRASFEVGFFLSEMFPQI